MSLEKNCQQKIFLFHQFQILTPETTKSASKFYKLQLIFYPYFRLLHNYDNPAHVIKRKKITDKCQAR